MLFLDICLFSLALLAAFYDTRTSKIPNALLLRGLGFILPLRLLLDTPQGVLLGMFGAFMLCASMFPFFSVGALGAGDIKLLALLALGMDPLSALQMVFASFLAGSLFSLGLLAMNRGKPVERVHLAPAICVGVLAALILG